MLLKATYRRLFVLLWIIVLGFSTLSAQRDSFEYNSFDELWPKVETVVKHSKEEKDWEFVLIMVRGYCDNEYHCLVEIYQKLIISFEEEFNLRAAIYLSKELLTLGVKEEDFQVQADVYYDLSRFYDALGHSRPGMVYLDSTIMLLEGLDDAFSLVAAKMYKYEKLVGERSYEAVLPQITTLQTHVMESGDDRLKLFLLLRLSFMLWNEKDISAVKEKLIEIKSIIDKYPDGLPDNILYTSMFYHKLTGDIQVHEKNYQDARTIHYPKALALCAVLPDKWNEITTYLGMAELEINALDFIAAQNFLDLAIEKAKLINEDNLLAKAYGLQMDLAKQNNDYKLAFESVQKQHYHENEFESKGKDFSVDNYLLEVEKDRLQTDKTNKELQLDLKNIQLRFVGTILFLFLLFTIISSISYVNIRKKKRALEEQNSIISAQSQKLSNLDKAKSRFFANISHELRTPLSLILGPLDTVLKGNSLNENQRHLLQMAKTNGEQLKNLVTDILDLNKLELGKLKVSNRPTKLFAFLQNSASQFDSLAAQNLIKYRLDISILPNLVAMIDKPKIRQVIINLLSNAFKHTPSKGTITFKAHLVDDLLELKVIDSGIGIKESDIPFLFDRYFQTLSPDKPAGGGSGIGLAICKEFTELMQGQIAVKSDLHSGTTFTVRIPVEFDILEEDERVLSEISNYEFQTLYSAIQVPEIHENTLLVVEDNLDLQEYIKIVLSKKYNVLLASNGAEALKIIKSQTIQEEENARIDLIISDLMMPVLDGYELLKKVKSGSHTKQIPFIILTGKTSSSDKLSALRIGVDDYMTKPFEESELLARVANLLNNKNSREEISTDPVQEAEGKITANDKEWLESFESYVREKFDQKISVPQLANTFAMSESTLLRQLKRLTGLSPSKYIQEVKLEKARWYLENHRNLNIKQIASKVGYSDVRNFSKSFKKRYGKSPSSY